MKNLDQTQKEKNLMFRHWHGLVQTATILVTLVIIGGLVYVVFIGVLQVYDAILAGETLLTFSVAVICSHGYNYQPDPTATPLQEKAAKLQATWLHANFCWQIINAWMTITPLYCTCATIYISGSSSVGKSDQVHILTYSIISLVLSLGIYVIRPFNRGSGFRKAYLSVSTALTKQYGSASNEELITAINEGQKIIASQDLLDPQ